MTAYGPGEARSGSVGIAVRLDGPIAVAVQDRWRSVVVETDVEGPMAARSIVDWARGGLVGDPPFAVRVRQTTGDPDQVAVLHGERLAVAYPSVEVRDSWLLFPGSFHPFHEGHARLAQIAHELTGLPVDFELSIRNVDKSPLHYRAMTERVRGLLELSNRPSFHGSAWLTSAPRFLDKARVFPGPVRFVVGMDTLMRIGDPRYYRDPDDCRRTIDRLAHEYQVSFLAFPRGLENGQRIGGDEVRSLPEQLQSITQIIPTEQVLDVLHVSSRSIRARGSGALPGPPVPTTLTSTRNGPTVSPDQPRRIPSWPRAEPEK